jgi:hypothetical protein
MLAHAYGAGRASEPSRDLVHVELIEVGKTQDLLVAVAQGTERLSYVAPALFRDQGPERLDDSPATGLIAPSPARFGGRAGQRFSRSNVLALGAHGAHRLEDQRGQRGRPLQLPGPHRVGDAAECLARYLVRGRGISRAACRDDA